MFGTGMFLGGYGKGQGGNGGSNSGAYVDGDGVFIRQEMDNIFIDGEKVFYSEENRNAKLRVDDDGRVFAKEVV